MSIQDALGALKSNILTINQSTNIDNRVWLYPQEVSSIDFSILPVVIITQEDVVENFWKYDTTTRDLATAEWTAEILIYVAHQSKNDPIAAVSKKLTELWANELPKVLLPDRTLGGKVTMIAFPEGEISWMVGQMQWWNKIYWGMRVLVPINQEQLF